jgi:hypothetical protein
LSVDDLLVDDLSVNEFSVDELSLEELSFDKLPAQGSKLIIRKELYINVMFTFSYIEELPKQKIGT